MCVSDEYGVYVCVYVCVCVCAVTCMSCAAALRSGSVGSNFDWSGAKSGLMFGATAHHTTSHTHRPPNGKKAMNACCQEH